MRTGKDRKDGLKKKMKSRVVLVFKKKKENEKKEKEKKSFSSIHSVEKYVRKDIFKCGRYDHFERTHFFLQ